jgi:hypothetical protein
LFGFHSIQLIQWSELELDFWNITGVVTLIQESM